MNFHELFAMLSEEYHLCWPRQVCGSFAVYEPSHPEAACSCGWMAELELCAPAELRLGTRGQRQLQIWCRNGRWMPWMSLCVRPKTSFNSELDSQALAAGTWSLLNVERPAPQCQVLDLLEVPAHGQADRDSQLHWACPALYQWTFQDQGGQGMKKFSRLAWLTGLYCKVDKGRQFGRQWQCCIICQPHPENFTQLPLARRHRPSIGANMIWLIGVCERLCAQQGCIVWGARNIDCCWCGWVCPHDSLDRWKSRSKPFVISLRHCMLFIDPQKCFKL